MVQLTGPAFDGLYGDLIMDHFRRPRNRAPLAAPTVAAHQFNPFCGDRIELQLLLNGAGAAIAVSARSEGCSIIQASASMMSEALLGRRPDEIRRLARDFRAMMQAKDAAAPDFSLGELDALTAVRRYPVRIKCALLPWVALEIAIDGLAPASLPGN